jgi:hypothetical protein
MEPHHEIERCKWYGQITMKTDWQVQHTLARSHVIMKWESTSSSNMQEDTYTYTHTHWAYQMVSMKEDWFRCLRDGFSWVNEKNWYEWLRASAWMDGNTPIHISFWYAVMWTVDGLRRMSANSMEHSPAWEINSWSGHSKNSLHIMESKGSLPCSQKPAICLC